MENTKKLLSIINVSKNFKSIDILLNLIESTDIVSDNIKAQAKDARIAITEIKNQIKNIKNE